MHGKRPAVTVRTAPAPRLPDRHAGPVQPVEPGGGKAPALLHRDQAENRFMHVPELIRMGAHAEIPRATP